MNPLIERLGWTLIHSLWQGTLAWILLKIALGLLCRRSAQARYLAACGALAAASLAPWFTFFQLDIRQRFAPAAQRVGAAGIEPSAQGPSVSTDREFLAPIAAAGTGAPPRSISFPPDAARVEVGALIRPAFPWIVGLWSAGFVASALRLLLDWKKTRGLARAPLAPLPEAMDRRFAALLARLRLKRVVRAGLSTAVRGPVVVGWLRPVVLLPAGFLAGLSPSQIEAVLIHELAHVRRADFLVNLLQATTEVLFFYHPALRAINRVIREEREHACDDLAVAMTGDATGYAHALAWLAASSAAADKLVLAATGAGGLLGRIRRLLGRSPAPAGPFTPLAWAALSGAVIYLGAMLAAPVLTAQVLAPEERIALVKQAVDIVAADSPGSAAAKDAKMTVSFTVATEDGGPPPAGLKILGRGDHGAPIEFEAGERRIQKTIPIGKIRLLLHAPGWAPSFYGPYVPSATGELNIPSPLLLRKGFPARLRVTDARSNPIRGMTLKYIFVRQASPGADHFLSYQTPHLTTDTQGEIAIANVDQDTELEVWLDRPGFQRDERMLRNLAPGVVSILSLANARPRQGTVTDATNGRPIPGAKILLAQQSDAKGSQTFSLNAHTPVLATTDENGKFVLNNLNETRAVSLFITATGYAPAVHEAPLDSLLPARLERGIRLAGRVRANPGQLPAKAVIRADYSLGMLTASGSSEKPLDPSLTEQPFVFENLPRARTPVEFVVAGRSFRVSAETDASDILLDLTPAPSSRTVTVLVRPPSGEPLPEGVLKVAYLKNPYNASEKTSLELPVRDGRAEFTLPAPNKLRILSPHLPGYALSDQAADIRRDIEVEAVPTPLEIDLPLVAAGAVHGRLADAAGTSLRGWFLTYAPVGPPPRWMRARTESFWSGLTTNEGGRFVAGGLPFDVDFRIVARKDARTAVSEIIRLTREAPVRQLEWIVPPAPDFSRLVRPDGSPLARATLAISYEIRPGHTLSGGPQIITDEQGFFVIPGLDLTVPGRYTLKMDSRRTWHPFIGEITRNTPPAGSIFSLTAGHLLSGRMLDASGHPLANLELTALPVPRPSDDPSEQARISGPLRAEEKTDGEGRFRFSNLPAGAIQLFTDRGLPEPGTVDIPGQSGQPVDFRLKQ